MKYQMGSISDPQLWSSKEKHRHLDEWMAWDSRRSKYSNLQFQNHRVRLYKLNKNGTKCHFYSNKISRSLFWFVLIYMYLNWTTKNLYKICTKYWILQWIPILSFLHNRKALRKIICSKMFSCVIVVKVIGLCFVWFFDSLQSHWTLFCLIFW